MITREEAIKHITTWMYATMDLQPVQVAKAFDMALAALRPISREQVERMRGEWQVCFEDWRKQIAGDQCSKCGFQHYGTSINHYHFCPACGAPMTDEALEILMKRLEKMHETM